MKKKIPEMLNVLTIITIGWSFMMLVSSIVNALVFSGNIDTVRGEIANSDIEGQKGEPFLRILIDAADTVLEHAELLNYNSIIVYLLSISAALFMRKLLKTGFWIYVLATALEISVPLIVLDNKLAAAAVIFGSVFSIVFIILYGVNYKHLIGTKEPQIKE